MKRVLATIVALALVGAAALAASGAGEATGKTYKVVFDNAFGLTEGVDLRVGGVRAGLVKTLDVERKTGRALVTVLVDQPGIGDFRSDAFCAIRPQSLIGDYFMDCQPGTKGRELPAGGVVPVEQTETTIPPDLVQSVLRRPYRERFALIFNELGAGFAGRGPDVNETIRRAIPALNQTDRVLKMLADNRAQLQSLNRNAAVVLDELADRRTDVTDFISEARDAASASAERRTDLATTFRRFPGFLSELRPTLANLATTAEEQTPALNDLNASADELTSFFNRLGPFADASRPALESLGEASKTGTQAARAARPTIAQIRELTRGSGELSNNLAIVLEHLEDRRNAVEKDRDSPGGEGYTGLEALLQYPFDQSQAINIFDQRGYLLKLLILENECSDYTNARTARENPERTKRCNSYLGPNQIGVTRPDPTATGRAGSSARRARRASRDRDGGRDRDSRPGSD
ncbi:MAG: MlaD family protein, partial [Actinomycetota bacterium]|nr:MlaD family protein [Actinomycetota bacterium]